MTTTKLILALAFFMSPSKVFANVDCITVKSIKSTSIDDARTYATCPSSHSTLVSCGGSTADRLSYSFDGAYIDSNVYPVRCYSQNANGGSGVYAHARCCNFIPNDIACEYHTSATWSATNDDAYVTTHCGTKTYDTMLGCSMFSLWGKIDGSYPGSPAVRPDTRSAFDTHNYPAYDYCTAQNGVHNTGGVKSNIACCASPTYRISCITRYGSPAHPASEVSCPDSYFMAGCSSWSHWQTNAWYIENDKCVARMADIKSVYASAICCRLETDSPTTDPTVAPTVSPTTVPTASPTIDPTISPTSIPTAIPSETPSESPIKKPTQSPTNNPSSTTKNPIISSSGEENVANVVPVPGANKSGDDNASVMSGLIGALAFLVLCLCSLALFALCCLWKKRKILKKGVDEENGESLSTVSSQPVIFPLEGAITTATKQRTNAGYGELQQNDDDVAIDINKALPIAAYKNEKVNLLQHNEEEDLLTMNHGQTPFLLDEDDAVVPRDDDDDEKNDFA